MRRIPLILALVVVTGLIFQDIYDFFVTDEGVRYFSSQPQRLISVVLLGLAGGVVAVGISRLSPDYQRTLKLAVLGSFGTALLIVMCVFAYHLARLFPMMRDAGAWVLLSAALWFVAFAAVAALVWLEFRQLWSRA
jgi:hypothetical protein